MFYLTKEKLPIFLPLGFIGLYRWFWFFLKIMAYALYKPLKPRNHPRYRANRDVTILVPTIDSGDEIKLAVRSWLKSDPSEIIFITIPSAKQALEDLVASLEDNQEKIRIVTINRPNKRNQMIAGVNHCKTPIVIFADDDVLWPPEMIEYILAAFEDKQVGGVGTSQDVMSRGKRFTMWEVLAGFRISMRNIEIVASTYIDGGVCCLSGRTAAYRTMILRDPEFQYKFTNEFWLGKYHQHSGDDKFLTRWLHSHQWKTFIQASPQTELKSTFKDDWHFLKQLTRWTRNTWRSDIRSLFVDRHIWSRHPYVAFTMLDKFFNPITLLAGPVTVVYLCTRTDQDELPVWVIIVSYLVWLLLTRLLKYIPHFIRRPQDVLFVPLWIVFNIYFALMKVYCLFTLHITDWGTRKSADSNQGGVDDTEIFVIHNDIEDKSNKPNKGSMPSSGLDIEKGVRNPANVIEIKASTDKREASKVSPSKRGPSEQRESVKPEIRRIFKKKEAPTSKLEGEWNRKAPASRYNRPTGCHVEGNARANDEGPAREIPKRYNARRPEEKNSVKTERNGMKIESSRSDVTRRPQEPRNGPKSDIIDPDDQKKRERVTKSRKENVRKVVRETPTMALSSERKHLDNIQKYNPEGPAIRTYSKYEKYKSERAPQQCNK